MEGKNGSKATYRALIVTFCVKSRVKLAETLKSFLLTSEKQSGSSMPSSGFDDTCSYLKECYCGLPHPASLQWPFASLIKQEYVDLEMFDVTADASKHNKPIVLKSLFKAGNSTTRRKVVLIEGVAGIGKTTLSWHACKEWAAGKLFEDIKLLIHVSLGDPIIQSSTKVADLIPHPSKEMRQSVAKVIADKRGEGVCFWLEGCDEAPPSLWNSFLYRFVAGTGGRSMAPNAQIILTSRPGYSSRLSTCLTGKVLIKGFQHLDSFIATLMIDEGEKLTEALRMKPELHSLCHVPLHAVILVYLYEVLKDNLPTTRTGLFDPLIRNFFCSTHANSD